MCDNYGSDTLVSEAVNLGADYYKSSSINILRSLGIISKFNPTNLVVYGFCTVDNANIGEFSEKLKNCNNYLLDISQGYSKINYSYAVDSCFASLNIDIKNYLDSDLSKIRNDLDKVVIAQTNVVVATTNLLSELQQNICTAFNNFDYVDSLKFICDVFRIQKVEMANQQTSYENIQSLYDKIKDISSLFYSNLSNQYLNTSRIRVDEKIRNYAVLHSNISYFVSSQHIPNLVDLSLLNYFNEPDYNFTSFDLFKDELKTCEAYFNDERFNTATACLTSLTLKVNNTEQDIFSQSTLKRFFDLNSLIIPSLFILFFILFR
ncbi:Uncharacterised protein [Candidatus Tiddalikarchaeum anstoanum]|nr:Uncharacterised protein [Candidatus Tiddalikarchaeum anstoanum]